MPSNDTNNDVAKQMSEKAKGMANKGAEKATRGIRNAGKNAVKNLGKKVA